MALLGLTDPFHCPTMVQTLKGQLRELLLYYIRVHLHNLKFYEKKTFLHGDSIFKYIPQNIKDEKNVGTF
jgi:hypothetical protein